MPDPEDTLDNAADAVADAAKGAADAVGDAAQSGADAVSDAAQGGADAVSDVAQAAADAGTAAAEGATDLASQAVEAGGDAVADTGEHVDAAAAAVGGAALAAAAGAGDTMAEAQATVEQAVDTAITGAEQPMVASPAQPPAQTAGGQMTMAQPRPAGISVLGTLAVLWGLLNLFVAPLAALGTTLLGNGFTAGVWTGTIGFIAGIVWLAIGFAFFRLKPWVWMLSLVVAGISVLQVLASALTDPSSMVCGLFGLIVPGIFLWYLTRPHVKAAFGR